MTRKFRYLFLSTIGLLCGCATESHNVVQTPASTFQDTVYTGPRYQTAIGRFSNKSSYEQGVFYEGTDNLGDQAKTILETDLEQTGHFIVLDRQNMQQISTESSISGEPQALHGAQILIAGAVTDFGRRTTGDEQLFGIMGAGKTQEAYAKVDLEVIDVKTSAVLYSVNGAGEYSLTNREVLGFGGTAGYDSIINGKVLNLAIQNAVEKVANGVQSGAWAPTR